MTKFLCLLIGIAIYLPSSVFAQTQAPFNFYKMAQEERAKGNYSIAIDLYTKALLERPQLWEAYAERGYCKARLKEYESAIIDYNVALSIGGDDPLLYFNRGWANYNLGYKAKACTDWRESQALGYFKAGSIIRSHCPQ